MATSTAPPGATQVGSKTTGRGETDDTDHTEEEGAELGEGGGGGSLRNEPVATQSEESSSTHQKSALGIAQESPSFRLTHLQSDSSLHLHVPISERAVVVLTTSGTMSAPPFISPSPAASGSNLESHDHSPSSSVPAPLNDFAHGSYAGVRLGEARNLGPATHDRDRAAEGRNARQRRVNEAGDSAPGSQGSLVRRVHNLQ